MTGLIRCVRAGDRIEWLGDLAAERVTLLTDENERLRSALNDLIAQLDAENELDDPRFGALWPALSRARAVLLDGAAP